MNKHSLFTMSLITVFAWEAYEHGTDVHTLADPTKLELMHKQFKEKKKNFKSDQQQSILEKVDHCLLTSYVTMVMLSQYGGAEHLDVPPKELLLAQTVRCCHHIIVNVMVTGELCGVCTIRYSH